MRVSIAQIRSERGKVSENIKNHLKFVQLALNFDSDLIVFPELSISNYEPELAQELAIDLHDSIFNPFQALSNEKQITIGIGMPTEGIHGIHISMIIFQPNEERSVYSKRILHNDELPYFVSGDSQLLLNIQGKKIALGICYETLQREHFVEAKKNNADLYIASVAKSKKGTDKAYVHFSAVAEEFKTPILMSNSIGPCDNFLANGLSSAWDDKGKLLGQLDEENQGLLIYDTASRNVITTYDLK